MGRKKIQISRITDERNRQVTFNKRKFGVMKKAYELSVLCDCEIALIIFSSSNRLYQYASTDMDKVLLKYTEYNEPHESLTNKDIVEVSSEALNKKEHKNGGMSPDSPDRDDDYTLTPRTEAKYSKIDEEFQLMMQRNGNRVPGISPQNYSMPVSVPVNSSYTEGMLHSPQMVGGHHNISPRPGSSSGGLLDVPGSNMGLPNGYPPGGAPSPQPSTPTSPSHRGKHENGSTSPRPNLRVVIPNSQSPSPGPVLDEVVSIHRSGVGNATLATPPVSINTPYQAPTFPAHDFDLSTFTSPWSSSATLGVTASGIHRVPHLSISSSTPPPLQLGGAPLSPDSMRIKSEPVSPPHGQLDHRNRGGGGTGHLSPNHHTGGPHTPGPSPDHHSTSPEQAHQFSISHHTNSLHPPTSNDFDSGPLSKRLRLSEAWAT
jgi:MADS-box transcription enhancer factor 2A